MTTDNPIDEYPALTAYLKHITDTKRLFNAAIYGQTQLEWAKLLSESAALATTALREVKDSQGEETDIILPNWEDNTNVVLMFTQRLSADAYLDFLQITGDEDVRDLYDDPPL